MKKTDILGIAFGNFWRRKTRSLLSVLGVVIGTASIVCMMSIGVAMKYNNEEQMKRYGNINQIRVYAGYDEKTGKQKELDDDMLAEIAAIENVKAVTPVMDLDGRLYSGKYQSYGQIMGIDISYLEALGLVPEQGRLLTNEDVSTGKTVYCLMGNSLLYRFEKPRRVIRSGRGGMMVMSSRGNGDEPEGVPENGYYYDGKIYDQNGRQVGSYPPPIDVMDAGARVKYTYDRSYGQRNPGETLTVKKKATLYNVVTVGILGEESGEFSYSMLIDLDTAKKINKDYVKWQNSQNQGGNKQKVTDTYQQAYALSNSLDNTMEIVAAIQALGLNADSDANWIKQQQETQNTMQMVLAGIGFVSLLVAAIGIANTMFMSIYERTREIGIMKVIGCYLRDIRTMFLTEAAFIGLFGGLAGVALSYGVSALMNFVTSSGDSIYMFGMSFGGGDGTTKMSVVPPWLALAAIAFAIVVALLSGFFPARRAMKLSALTAMQN